MTGRTMVFLTGLVVFAVLALGGVLYGLHKAEQPSKCISAGTALIFGDNPCPSGQMVNPQWHPGSN